MIREGRPLLPSVIEDMGNPPWDAARGRILIVRLSRWQDVCQSSSHIFLFGEARKSLPKAFLDFAFLPPKEERMRLSRSGEPWFSGRASGASPRDFDLILVSNAFALELVNLPYLFSTAGLPIEAEDRATLPACPLVIAGGSNASAMGALVLPPSGPGAPALASFVDGIFFGEGEDRAGRLASILLEGSDWDRAGKASGRLDPERRQANLKTAAELEGFWPCLHSPGARRVLAPGRPRNDISPLVLNSPTASAARLAITSGCPGYCSFCLEGWDRSPYAEGEIDRLLSEASRIRASTGASDLELFSYNFNTHSRIGDLIFNLNKGFAKVSFMSQRLDILARSSRLFELELAAGKRLYTLGVEGISARMRSYYRKGLEDSDLETCMDLVFRPGPSQVKLFYIISGLEEREDIEEFSAFLAWAEKRRSRGTSKLLVSAGFLVRLPFTPLQYSALSFDAERLNSIATSMREACERSNAEFRLAASAEESFVDQALSLLGDLCRPWLATLPSHGFTYDARLSQGTWKSLHAYLEGAKGDEFHERTKEKDGAFRPPLSFIVPESRHLALWKHYTEAKSGKDRPSCLGASCTACSACSDPGEVATMTGHSGPGSYSESLISICSSLLSAKSRFQPCYAAVELGPGLAGAESAYRSSWILRSLSRLRPGIESLVFEAREQFVPDVDTWYGFCVYALYGPAPRKLGKMLAGLPAFWPLETPPPNSILLDLELELGPWSESRLAASREAFESWSTDSGLGYTSRKMTSGWAFSSNSREKAGKKALPTARLERIQERIALGLSLSGARRLRGLVSILGEVLYEDPVVRVLGWESLASVTKLYER
ncbi:MAG TPA: hypothetical protein VIO60_05330 [Rectinemataceae bacterium]